MKYIITIGILISVCTGWAKEAELVSNVTVNEIESFTPFLMAGCDNFDINTPIIITPGERKKLNNIVNTGKFIWEIIKENKPTLNVSKQSASALPDDLSWTEMQCWNLPASKTYEILYSNGFGVQVVAFQFQIQYTYGGHYKGVGRYLNQVTILPKHIDVLWGYNFDAQITTPSIVNINTSDFPVAGMELQVDWTISTLVKKSRQVMSFFVTGEGDLYQVGD